MTVCRPGPNPGRDRAVGHHASLQLADRVLQRWRIAAAAAWIPAASRILDVGCGDGMLFRVLADRHRGGVGIDPTLTAETDSGSVRLIRGSFPDAVPHGTFDVVTMLAVIEHLPVEVLAITGPTTAQALRPGGRAILTVPAPTVDRIVDLLVRLRLAEGMTLHEHHGFDPAGVPSLFVPHGFRLLHHRRFELGLNHLYVFERSL